MPEFTVKEVAETLKGEILEAANGVLEGAKEDIVAYAQRISEFTTNALLAPAERRADLLKEIVGQLKLLGELSRIRAVNAQWEIFTKIVKAIQGTALTLIKYIPTLPGLPGVPTLL